MAITFGAWKQAVVYPVDCHPATEIILTPLLIPACIFILFLASVYCRRWGRQNWAKGIYVSMFLLAVLQSALGSSAPYIDKIAHVDADSKDRFYESMSDWNAPIIHGWVADVKMRNLVNVKHIEDGIYYINPGIQGGDIHFGIDGTTLVPLTLGREGPNLISEAKGLWQKYRAKQNTSGGATFPLLLDLTLVRQPFNWDGLLYASGICNRT